MHDEGYSEQQTRMCDSDLVSSWNDTVDISQCVQLTCSEMLADSSNDTYNQFWPEIPADSVYKSQGGIINALTSPINTYNTYNTNQVSTTLQAMYAD